MLNYFGLWIFLPTPKEKSEDFYPFAFLGEFLLLSSPEYKQASLTSFQWWKDRKHKEVFQSFHLTWDLNRRQSIISLILCIITLPSSNLEVLKTASKWTTLELIFSTAEWKKGMLLLFSVPLNGSVNLLICRYILKASNYTPIVKWKDSQHCAEMGSKCCLKQLITNFTLMLHICIPLSVNWYKTASMVVN